jgi:hypothetical protein
MGNVVDQIALEFVHVRHQECIPQNEEDKTENKLQNGDLLILALGHEALDFVGLTMNSILILGQISLMKYDGVNHNLWKLFQKKIGCLSIMDFYRECAGKLALPEETNSFAQDTKYVYVTTSTEYLTKRANAAKDPAFIIDGEALANLFDYPHELDRQPAPKKQRTVKASSSRKTKTCSGRKA